MDELSLKYTLELAALEAHLIDDLPLSGPRTLLRGQPGTLVAIGALPKVTLPSSGARGSPRKPLAVLFIFVDQQILKQPLELS